MKNLLVFIIALLSFTLSANANGPTSWSHNYQNLLMEKVGQEMKRLSTYPSLEYPNRDIQQILEKFPEGKVLLFGYGSLINADSAAWSVSSKAVQSMRPMIAFGFKRIFNYTAQNVSARGLNLSENERAMLNIVPTTTYNHIINGVVMEISREDLHRLVQREVGYDLVPMLVTDWNQAIAENPSINIKIAYTFFVPSGLRDGVNYTQAKYYPIRRYLHTVRDGAAVFGPKFLNYWNETTYLGDGRTPVNQWDEKTFSGILDSREP